MKTSRIYLMCVILICTNLLWLGFNAYVIAKDPKLLELHKSFLIIMSLGFLFFLLSHIIILSLVVLSYKRSKFFALAGKLLLVTGITSIVALLVYFLAFDQIIEDLQYNDPFVMMRNLALLSESVVIFFFVFSLFYFITLVKKDNYLPDEKSIMRERFFIALNFLGVVCSIIALLLVWFDFKFLGHMDCNISANHPVRSYDFFPFLFIALPYLSAFTGWRIFIHRDKKRGWFDEKLHHNIIQSGNIALWSLIPLMIGLIVYSFFGSGKLYVTGDISVLWLLVCLFGYVLIYSTAVLFNYKMN